MGKIISFFIELVFSALIALSPILLSLIPAAIIYFNYDHFWWGLWAAGSCLLAGVCAGILLVIYAVRSSGSPSAFYSGINASPDLDDLPMPEKDDHIK